LFFLMMTPTAFLLICLLVLVACTLKWVPEGQVYSVYRYGKFQRLLQPGFHGVLPVLERISHRMDLSGQVLRFEELLADAHDVRGTVYWQVLEPERADAVFSQLDQLIRRGAVDALREEAAVNVADRRVLGTRMKQVLNSALRERGMMVTRVELDIA
ncbi:MAG: SPFH domain-containing protein, partial [Rhodanobacter sp.]